MSPNLLSPSAFEQACVCQAIRRISRSVSRRYEVALRPVGLKAGQFSILAALNRDEPIPLGALARTLGMEYSTLSRDLAPLQRRGLVESVSVPDDQRVRGLRLTDTGRALLAEATPLWRAAQQDSHTRLRGADWPALRAMLDPL